MRGGLIGLVVVALLISSSEALKSKHQKKRHHGHAHKKGGTEPPPDFSKVKALRFKNAAVAADNYNCSKIGRDIFKKGGHAIDAIIATHCCVEVVNLHSTGLGGGGFLMVHDKEKGISTTFDFRETLPMNYVDTTNKTQGETILVPGVMRGLEAAWKKFGKLPWKVLFEPAIKLAEEGFTIHDALAAAIKKKKDFINTNLGLRELFAPNNEHLKLGDILKRPKLANTFRQIAESGNADIFYTGSIAQQIVKDIKEVGGVMELADLAAFQAVERPPLKTKVGGLTMMTTPTPGSGALIALIMKIMDGFKWGPKDLKDHPALTYHRMVEAMKFGYAPYSFMGDPRYNNHTKEVEKYMTDPQVAESMMKRIDNVSHTVDYYQPYSKLSVEEQNGTSHMSAMGPNGDAVSLTSSINAYFGSKLRSRELGFIYNNELADFAEFWPTVYNLTKDKKAPGKRPMSKSSPTIFVDKDKNVEGVFGAAGGFFIPSCLTMTMANWLFFKDDLKVAVARPRLHCQLFPPTVVYEPTFPVELVPQLESYSHAYVTNSTYDVSGQMDAIMGVVQAIVKDHKTGEWAAESDYRKGGMAAGY